MKYRLCVHDVTGLVRKSDAADESDLSRLKEISNSLHKYQKLHIVSGNITYTYNTQNIVSVWVEELDL